MQWPSWDGTLMSNSTMEKKDSSSTRKILEQEGGGLVPPPPPPAVVAEEKGKSSQGMMSCSDTATKQQQQHPHQMGNNTTTTTSRMLASCALEELAGTRPSRSASIPCVFPRSDAPSSTTGVSNGTATTGVVAAAAATTAPVTQQPSLPPVGGNSTAPNPPRVFGSKASGRQTAQLAIFYAGTVNVFNDVTQEKAHLIMLLAANRGASWTSSALAKFISSQAGSSIMSAPSVTKATAIVAPVQNVTPAAAAANNPPPIVPRPSALPLPLPPSDQGHSIVIRQLGTESSQKQASLLLPELSQMTTSLNVSKGEQSVVISLPNAPSMQAEKKIAIGPSAEQGNELPLELPQASNSVSCAIMRGSSVCYTQELPHARKTSLVRFLDM